MVLCRDKNINELVIWAEKKEKEGALRISFS
jgi:hypothetical protein